MDAGQGAQRNEAAGDIFLLIQSMSVVMQCYAEVHLVVVVYYTMHHTL
jgi:hypothetical protein